MIRRAGSGFQCRIGVVRRTNKFVFIEQQPYSPDELTGSWFDREAPTFRLNRRMLEQEGFAFVPPTAYVEDAEEFTSATNIRSYPEKSKSSAYRR